MEQSNSDKLTVKRNRRTLFVIVGMLVAAILLSTLLYQAAIKGQIDVVGLLGTKNQGVLVSPPIAANTITPLSENGTAVEFAQISSNWAFVVPLDNGCDADCQNALYLTRQVHVALGREAKRMQRFMLAATELTHETQELIENDYPQLRTLLTSPDSFQKIQQQIAVQDVNAKATIYLFDPQGWLMMVYTAENTGKEMLSDLRFLMKYSSDKVK